MPCKYLLLLLIVTKFRVFFLYRSRSRDTEQPISSQPNQRNHACNVFQPCVATSGVPCAVRMAGRKVGELKIFLMRLSGKLCSTFLADPRPLIEDPLPGADKRG
jgi:hypothetical protein